MDSLDDFEKQLAAEKAERDRVKKEKEERRERKHRHRERDRDRDRSRSPRHHSDRHSNHRSRHDEEDAHRSKRSRHSKEDDESDRHRDRHRHRERDREREPDWSSTDPKQKLPLPDEEATPVKEPRQKRDAWMTTPSGIDIDYVQRPDRAAKEAPLPEKEEPKRVIHRLELNASHLQGLNDGVTTQDGPGTETKPEKVDYVFGDDGSQWRMTRLKAVYTTAEQSGRPVDEVAVERFGSLEAFDAAREERIEVDRRKVYGRDYIGKEKPTGELHRERKLQAAKENGPPEPEQGMVIPDDQSISERLAITQTDLNRLRAELMKAKLRRAPNAAQLESEYDDAVARFKQSGAAQQEAKPVIIDAMSSRMLAGPRAEARQVDTKRGRERGKLEDNDDMTIEDMVREERRTRGQAGGEGMRLAERIAKDGKFDNDLEYMDDNAEKLARRVHKSEVDLRSSSIAEFQRQSRALDKCPLCHHEDSGSPPVAPVVSLATRVYLTLPTAPEISDGGAVIVPTTHRRNLLECDDDEWEEIRNFMKALTRMYHEQGREVLFYENAANPERHGHAAMVAVAIPYDEGATAPAFFREAFLSADEEWAQHKKIIDTGKMAREGGMGRMAFRRAIAKEMPYFHVWFSLDGGLGHVVEDKGRWPRGDLFAREVVGGMLDVAPDVIKKQGRWRRGGDEERVGEFRKWWRRFDWTRVLADG